jgi:hypothetical protein
MPKNILLEVCMEYALSEMPEGVIDKIIEVELSRNEKIEILRTLSNERIKLVLFKMGFTQEFLSSL